MKKSTLSLLIGALLSLLPSQLLAWSFGYTTGEASKSKIFRVTTGGTQGVCIKMDAEKIKTLKGSTISGVEFVVGSKRTTGSKITLFVSTDLTADPVRSETATIATANVWQSATLSNPYTITGDEQAIYVGYLGEINSSYQFCSADFSQDIQDCCFAYDEGKWMDVYGRGVGAVNVRATINDAPAFNDVMMKNIPITAYYRSGETYQVNGTILNIGSNTVTNMTVDIQVGSQPAQHMALTNLNILPGSTYSINVPLSSTEGNCSLPVSIEVSQVNSADGDADITDNKVSDVAYFYPADMERNILIENFTSQTCSNCPSGHSTLHRVLEESGMKNLIQVSHHAGYEADRFTMKEDGEYCWFYGVGTTFAPAVMFNRLTNTAVSSAPIVNTVQSDIEHNLEYANLQQPYVSLSMETTYNEATREVTLDMGIYTHTTTPSAENILNVFLVQDSIKSYQVLGGSDYVHNSVFRGTLTGGAWGLLVDLKPGEVVHYKTQYTLPEQIRSTYWAEGTEAPELNGSNIVPTVLKDMRLVGYVAAYSNSDYNACQVYNSVEARLGENSVQKGYTSGIDTPAAQTQQAHKVYAQDGIIKVSGQYDNYRVYNMAGAQMPGARTNGAGIYMVRVQQGQQAKTYKVCVK